MSSSLTPRQKPQSHVVLKAVVIGMGVLIAVGLAVVVVTIVNRLGAGGESKRDLGTITHAIPQGASVAGMTADGGRLYLRLRLADGSERIDIVDAKTGKRLGVIALTPEER